MTVAVNSATSRAGHSRVVGSARSLTHLEVRSRTCSPTPWTDLAGDAATWFERPAVFALAERLVPVAARFT